MNTKPQLISFKLCPFVQRSVITLLEKQVEFDIKYIDLSDKPDWFLKISPFGKVPVLKVDETVLFESAVINEYLDETCGERMHPADALKRAHNRAWIEFGSNLLFQAFRLSVADNIEKYELALQEVEESHRKLEAELEKLDRGPFFNGENLSLIDAAYAPHFMRITFIDRYLSRSVMKPFKRISAWAKHLATRESVKNSVVDNLEELYLDYLKDYKAVVAEEY